MEFMIELYLENAMEAIETYKKAFDAEVTFVDRSPEGQVIHSELRTNGQIIAIASAEEEVVAGSIFQICVRMKKEEEVRRIYSILEQDCKVNVPLGPCSFSTCMVDFVDKFQVRWCLFVD